MNSKSILKSSSVIVALYLLFVALYFLRHFIGCHSRLWLDVTKTLPVLFLGVVTLLQGSNRAVACALILSAAGDLAGEEHLFLWQIALFALAHIAYISAFVRRRKPFNVGSATLSVAWVVALLLFGAFVVSHIQAPSLKIACSVYMLIIGSMSVAAFNIHSQYRVLYIVAALLFVLSDSAIAWNKFIGSFDCAGVLIMSTYFAAQGLFAWCVNRER